MATSTAPLPLADATHDEATEYEARARLVRLVRLQLYRQARAWEKGRAELARLVADGNEFRRTYAEAPEGMKYKRAEQLRDLRKVLQVGREMEDFAEEIADAETVQAFQDLHAWVQARIDALAPSVEAFERARAESLREHRDELKELAAEWSELDTDGLPK